MPALLTNPVSPPEGLVGRGDGGIPLVGLGDVEVHVAGGVTEFVGQHLPRLVEDVTDDDLAAFGHQRSGVGRTHALCAAADQYNFAVHASHDA